MTISDQDKVDIVRINRGEGIVHLIIADHLPWGCEEGDEKEHMYLLQEKINLYLSYIEGEQLLDDFPNARGLDVGIQVYGSSIARSKLTHSTRGCSRR
ncbi:DUF6572 domain-containing protein [Chelativorans salis]|uniref:Uncharacterized protein n=1 Tax=Chelativorans salis TaxID=2978478 RepID=A0ABT2LMJ1_9HYPH|nr:DUF6572 domain-containing protein [Chelativorans sp. EGI FJ00035]MCT7375057.1 hypothetical protein [Chelativorans sp. EGI FJ00035]